jgi:hypothetical protein
MAFHLAHPSLTTSGKRKGPRKFRNAAEAQRARENQDNWNELLKQHGVAQQEKKRQRAMKAEVWKPSPVSYRGSELPRIPSRETTWEPCTKAPDKVYTGDAILGISTMHKSNAVPVFNQQAAIDISKMRR